MDLGALSAYSGMDAVSQYAAPTCYELCGKSFAIMRGMDYRENMFPAVTFAENPEMTVMLDGAKFPYTAAKITDDMIFAAFQKGTEIYAGVFDPSKSLTPEQAVKRVNTLSDPDRLLSATFFVGASNPSNFAVGPSLAETDTDFTGNVVEWTFAPGMSARFDYNAGYGSVSIAMPGGMPPFSASFSRLHTAGLANGVYFQAIQIDLFGSAMWIMLAMNFNKVLAAGAVFGSAQGSPFSRPIGGYGKVLNTGDIKTD